MLSLRQFYGRRLCGLFNGIVLMPKWPAMVSDYFSGIRLYTYSYGDALGEVLVPWIIGWDWIARKYRDRGKRALRD